MVMDPILRFLQLLCENHNAELQNFLRDINNKSKYSLVSETLMFLDCICGSTTGGLGLLGLYINEHNVHLIVQTLKTLTEYCQGPCHENQNCIATHESNGLDIIIALILNDINPLGKTRMDLVLDLKNNASKLLLAIMESRADSENAERILANMNPRQLLEVACRAYYQDGLVEDTEDDPADGDDGVSPREVGHNIYILCHQLSHHNRELQALLRQTDNLDAKMARALEYYRTHTAQIEIVRSDRTMEQIVFPIPEICEYLTHETQIRVHTTVERDEQGSKVQGFFDQCDYLFDEMKWQKKLRGQPLLFRISNYMCLWSRVLFFLAVIINMLVAISYPFTDDWPVVGSWMTFTWAATFVAAAGAFWFPGGWSFMLLFLCVLSIFIFTAGLESVIFIVGLINLVFKGIHVASIMGNKGSFEKTFRQRVSDYELLYHFAYFIVCVLGLSHCFFYSLLLFDVVYREETLLNVMKSVTKNGRSIVLTGVLALILVYLFSIIGFIFFQDDFVVPVSYSPRAEVAEELLGAAGSGWGSGAGSGWCDAENADCALGESPADKYVQPAPAAEAPDEERRERACETLIMCIVTTLNQGLRNGGGIGDVLLSPSRDDPLFTARVIYDLLFFFVVIIIVLNLIFGVIIDTFADLRSDKQQKEEVLKNSCFICALQRGDFDNKVVTFEEHIRSEHNMWHYLFFIVLIKVKVSTEFTGPESYVSNMVEEKNLDWFPRMRAMSLQTGEAEGEQNDLRGLQGKLDLTMGLVKTLSEQLAELRDQMSEQRKQKQRFDLLQPVTHQAHPNDAANHL